MRQVLSDPGGHRFLIKALSEAGNELAEEIYGCPNRLLDRRDDDGWSIRLLAAHIQAHEEMVAGYLDRILSERCPELDVIDTEAVLDEPDRCRTDAEHAVLMYAHLRRRVQYLLWDLTDEDWDRTGIHPYRGAVSMVQLARELHLHDLECLWRARRLKEHRAVGNRQ
jgi:HD-GYP domain-containing protein (c-di-GMP phosphodiesterase class II)